MRCQVCGGGMAEIVTDLPFKVRQKTIVILRDLPVHQCDHCGEYLLQDPVMERVEAMLGSVGSGAELEIFSYAAA